MQPFAPVDPTRFVLGDIQVGSIWLVTPYGSAPMHGARFEVHESFLHEQRMPQWAIIAAVLTALFCFVGLFFLLVKESVVSPAADITVTSGSFRHTTRVRVLSPVHMQQIYAAVAAAQQLADTSPS